MKLGMDEARTQAIEQIAADILRKLAAIDKNVSAGHATRANNIRRKKANWIYVEASGGEAAVDVLEGVLHELGSVLQVELVFDVFPIGFHRADAQAQFFGN